MGALAATRSGYGRFKTWLTAYLDNADPYAGIANTGAFLVWSNQPFYPLYVAWFVGYGAWPALLTWLSSPFFAAVPVLARKNTLNGRALFVLAGLANTLLAVKAFGPGAGIAWFFVPCLLVASTFFRGTEWRMSLVLCALTGAAFLVAGHTGAPLHVYTPEQYGGLTKMNIYSASGLTLYLAFAVTKLRWRR